jgi:hypothetical protein
MQSGCVGGLNVRKKAKHAPGYAEMNFYRGNAAELPAEETNTTIRPFNGCVSQYNVECPKSMEDSSFASATSSIPSSYEISVGSVILIVIFIPPCE